MINVNQIADAIKNFDAGKLDPTKFDLSDLDLSKIEFPKFDMPKFDMPKFDMPEMPKFEMPDFPKFEMPEGLPAEVDKIAGFVRDVTYAGIGISVIAAQKIDEEVRKLVAKAA